MAFNFACLILQRVVLPVALILAALFRPVGISFVYLLMFFISPFIPVATRRNFKGSVTPYLIILIALSTIVLLCHIALQVTIASLSLEDGAFPKCSFTEQLLRHIGFIDFRHLRPLAIVEWLTPEVIVFGFSLAVYLAIKRLTTVPDVPAQVENGEVDRTVLTTTADRDAAAAVVAAFTTAAPETSNGRSKGGTEDDRPNFIGLIKISPFFCLATLFFAAVLRPSVPGGFYFLIFLLSGSYWATFKTLKRGFAAVMRLVMVVIVMHTLCIVAYQTPWMQQHLAKDNLIARLIGLEPLVTSDCSNDTRIIVYNFDYKLDSFMSPIVLFFTYYVLALTTKKLIKRRTSKATSPFRQQLENGSKKPQRHLSFITQSSRGRESWKSKTHRLNVSLHRDHHQTNTTDPTETTPLVRQTTRKARGGSQQTDGAAIDGDRIAGGSSIQMENMDHSMQEDEESHASFFEQIAYGILSIGGFIYQNSYIFTNILMMAWSIVYHSWLTFVLLLWGNLLWMIPNQRKAMMRSSPFIVIYGEVLVVAQYIYGMDLTNDELPSKVELTGINLAQIGLDRPQEHDMQPCVPLIVKTSFLLMFWVTLRQFFKEKSEKRRSSALADMIGPISLTMSAPADGASRPDGKKSSKFLKKTGAIIKNLLVRLWIWLLVLVIFLCAITGQKMTGFRICYMGLFLFFLLVFQSSSKAWVRIMYGFWLFLIFYAMSILILVYTYQFDKFDQYWSDYLNISKTLQTDIGLERYKTKDLFLHLLSPTLIVILTVIQVHYFHRRFIDSLEQPSMTIDPQRPRPRPSLTARASRLPKSIMESELTTKCSTSLRIIFSKVAKQLRKGLKLFKKIFWPLLDLHIVKLVYFVAFLCSISDVCLLHIVLVALCLIGAVSRSSVQVFVSRIISSIVTVIILTKMIYQVAYLDHHHYDVHCSNETENNAVWMGLDKASPETGGLMGLLKPYIIYMVVVTLHAVVSLRQLQMRLMTGTLHDQPPLVLFPEVQRADAEKNLEGMIKYLFNYGFYKFGLEACLIALVATIARRQDIISVLYAFWLLVMLCCDRNKCGRVLKVFQVFLATSIFIQYVFLVGLPPGLCLHYPWVSEAYGESIQRWAMLPGNLHFNHASKLIFDFVMLLMVNRQNRVFALEVRLERSKETYPGGSNKSVIEDIANLGQVPFDNPTRDFLSHIRNYLDIFKNMVLCGFYWITLAVIFLAGTNISDFLALGYLVGAFIFLWQGSDFYLRPIHTIIKRWQWFIYYNVANIVIKTCLQMAGCLFMQQLTAHCCWLVHMLGITCSSRGSVHAEHVDQMVMDLDLEDDCPATTAQRFLLWDALCFSFLILQLRIFQSHYFCHIIIDTKANSILASRGAELIEDLRQKQIQHRHGHEKEVLHKIKRKMEKIRATQQKLMRPLDKPTHFDGAELAVADNANVIKSSTAPLARNSSFSSCQGSGYRTPDDEDSVSESTSSSATTAASSTSNTRSHAGSRRSSSSSEEEHAQLLDTPVTPHDIRVDGCDDFASDAQTIFADVNSVSDTADVVTPAILPGPTTTPVLRRLGVERLRLPEVDIQLTPQQTTPSSELMTMPFDGFLDVNRLSMGSAANSDMRYSIGSAANSDFVGSSQLQRDSDDELSEVFSPAPYIAIQTPSMNTLLLPIGVVAPTSCSLNVNVSAASSVISSNLTASGAAGSLGGGGNELTVIRGGGRHQRNPSVNAVSWSETVSIKCAPDEEAVSAELNEDIPVTLREKSLHRRHLSMGNASYPTDDRSTTPDMAARRRSSNVSWAREETYIRAAGRPNSWGPVEHGYPVPRSMPLKRKNIKLHPQDDTDATENLSSFDYCKPHFNYGSRTKAVRAGDYYMFEDMDEKFELDLIDDEVDFLEDQDKIIESDKKLSRRKTLADVWKDIQGAEFRRQVYVRQRSYASAPGSRLGLKIDEDFADAQSAEGDGVNNVVGVRTSTHSEPLDLVRRTTSEYFEQSAKADKSKDTEPTTSKGTTVADEPSESKKKPRDVTDSGDVTDKDSDDDLSGNPIVRLLEAFLVSVAVRLNRFSRNYRYVNKILAEEKKALKESQSEYNRLGRAGASAMFNAMRKAIESDEMEPSTSSIAHATNTNETPQGNNNTDITNIAEGSNTPTMTTITTTTPQSDQLSQAILPEQQQQEQPEQVTHVVDMIEMPLDTVDARTASRPEPGSSNSLAKGRRTKADIRSSGIILPDIRIRAPSFERTIEGSASLCKQWSYERVDSTTDYDFEEEDFASREHHIIIEVLISAWFAVLSNTDLICYLVVFLNQVVNASIISLPLPLMVFLWGTLSLPRPTKTFWVTLIAYTQAVVLVKCIFQFKLIWANYNNLPHQPLAPAKIFGVEMNPHYASYDLVLLLVLFFHRFILKSQGVWKTENKDVIVHSSSLDKDIAEASAEPTDRTNSLRPTTPPNEQEILVSNPQSVASLSDSDKEDVMAKEIQRFKRAKYISSLRNFFINLTRKARLPTDVYALMFLCDFINFFVLLFGFTSFSSRQVDGDGGVQAYLAENKVPVPFLIMLLVQFILIVIDRALYLRKALVYKIIFHFCSVIGIHIWMFFVVPAVTERSFYNLVPPIIFYIIKCFYMLLSSYQIKCGYPKRILGNFLTKSFSMANMISFKVYNLIPFLYELRTILDWVCTDTTMTMFDWLKMEDIFTEIYFIKSSRQMETDFPAMRAQKKAITSKLMMGGVAILCIVIAIWGPLCIFALFNAVGQPNLPYEVSVSIRIGSYDPIYSTINRESIIAFSDDNYCDMQNAYTKDSAVFFLSNYDPADVAAIKLAGNAPSLWSISPPDKQRLLDELKANKTMTARFTYSFTRVPPAKGLEGTVGSEITAELNQTFSDRAALIELLEGGGNSTREVVLPNLIPKFIKVLNSGETLLVNALMPEKEEYRNLVIRTHSRGSEIWWEIKDYCKDLFYTTVLSKLPECNCDSGIVIYLFNDKKFPQTLSALTGGGIIGLYTTLVLVASRILKSALTGQSHKIMFEDLPYVDRVLQLCLDIYLVREALEFALEEDLFAKLLFLYRSPETMIKWTRPKEEVNDDETDTESLRSRRPEPSQQQLN